MKFEKLHDVIIAKGDELFLVREEIVKKIADNTSNTWQGSRESAEKERDTAQGKIAENIVSYYIKESLGLKYIDYDEFRTNNFKKHAPFDGLISVKPIKKEFLEKINKEVSQDLYGRVSDTLRQEMMMDRVFTVEIKSTKVGPRHKRDGDGDAEVISLIKNDHYLVYPKFLRASSSIVSVDDYISYLKTTYKLIVDKNTLSDIELPSKNHFYIRVYLDFITKKVYIVGFITKNTFFIKPEIKKNVQRYKSDDAIYFVASIRKFNTTIDKLRDEL